MDCMPMLRPRVSPSPFLYIHELEHGVCYHKIMLSREAKQQLSIGVYFSDAVLPNHAVPCYMVSVHTGIEVTWCPEV